MKQERVICRECGEEGAIKNMYRVELYDTPWGAEPRLEYAHKLRPANVKKENSSLRYYESCEELLTDTGWASFRYFECPDCDRMVCSQNPRNGCHSQVRVVEEEELCLKCYEAHILEHGVERDQIAVGQLPGMFFSSDNHEPLEAGYTCVHKDYFVGDPKSLIAEALALIDSGHKVVIGYESMSIGGLEGTVSLFAKKEENHDKSS